MPDTQRAMVYVRQVLEDEYVQEQLRNAATGLRDVYERTRRQRAQATEDKRLYANLRQAATSIRNVATALQKKPPPEPKRRRTAKIAVLTVAIGGTAWLAMKMQKAAGEPDRSPAATETSTATGPTAPPTVAAEPATTPGGPATAPA